MNTRRFPAEWETQSGIMLTWPHQHSNWRGMLADVEAVFTTISRHVCAVENLLIVAFDHAHVKHIQATLNKAKVNCQKIIFISVPSNDIWARDHGPICVLENNQPVLLDFIFNGWGEKHAAELDNKISLHLFKNDAFAHHPLVSVNFVLEGGSIESNGDGTLLTTTCLLSRMRNPAMQKQDIEATLKELLGATHILWLTHGELIGDDTDGHIDTLARFCDANTILYTQCQDEQDPHYQSLAKMHHELTQMRTAEGQAYQLKPIPLPPAVFNKHNHRLPATYANFLIINNAVLLPIYNLVTDNKAIDIVQQCFPDRNIIPINCLPLIEQYGSLHCVTMQFPAEVFNLNSSVEHL
ncbi:MAG: agmatine deiminase family protein [Gammaproteobacteria bacterium]|nr:agmatine deiminase family protein [Gammaproteobacteria bacterium]